MPRSRGFLEFEEIDPITSEQDESILISCELTSSANVTAAGGTLPASASRTFSDDGMRINGYGAGIGGAYWADGIITGFAANKPFLITLWFTKDAFDITGASLEYFLNIGSNANAMAIYKNESGSSGRIMNAVDWFTGASSTQENWGGCHTVRSKREQFIRMDISYDGLLTDFYVDYVPVHRMVGATAFSDSELNVWQRTNNATGPTSAALYRVQVSSRPISLASPWMRDWVVMLGDSLFQQGGLYVTTHPPTARASAVAWGGGNVDAGCGPQLRKIWTKRGLQSPIQTHALANVGILYGGGGVNFDDQITDIFSNGKRPKIGIADYGAADVKNNVSAMNADQAAAWATQYKTDLTNCASNGMTDVILCTICSVSNDTLTLDSAEHNLAVDYCNQQLQSFKTDLSGTINVHLVDLFTATGGHGSGNPNFGAGDDHWSQLGNLNAAEVISPKLESLVFG